MPHIAVESIELGGADIRAVRFVRARARASGSSPHKLVAGEGRLAVELLLLARESGQDLALDLEPGADPDRRDYASLAGFADPDGNTWVIQEIGYGRLGLTERQRVVEAL